MDINNNDLQLMRDAIELAMYRLFEESGRLYHLQTLGAMTDHDLEMQNQVIERMDKYKILKANIDSLIYKRINSINE